MQLQWTVLRLDVLRRAACLDLDPMAPLAPAMVVHHLQLTMICLHAQLTNPIAERPAAWRRFSGLMLRGYSSSLPRMKHYAKQV